MTDQEMLARMQQTWPETDDYLARVGQVNNDLQVLREISERDQYEASLTWLDRLAVSITDLTELPSAVTVLQHLHLRGMSVATALTVPGFREIQEEHAQQYQEGYESSPEVLDGPVFGLPQATEQALWALPELQEKLLSWATDTATRHEYQGPTVTLAQAAILLNTVRFLEQEAEPSPGWAAECLRFALSSEFFKTAASPQQ
ncbi:hypothetical protein [Leucobacter musarum]|uniref:hypothetical protein n=1 Tax=Leucobacter musarum TaxID=1930747 RepID=UPI0006A788CC|nr:hypothetical protein [Leucobacter musarum]